MMLSLYFPLFSHRRMAGAVFASVSQSISPTTPPPEKDPLGYTSSPLARHPVKSTSLASPPLPIHEINYCQMGR